MKKKKHVNVQYFCPICGNPAQVSDLFNRRIEYMFCKFCRQKYDKADVAIEKEMKR